MPTILFVDEDELFLRSLQRLLRKHPVAAAQGGEAPKVMVARGVGDALANLRQHSVDLVVSGVRLKGLDGVQFLRLLHRQFPRVATAVIAAPEQMDSREACLGAGARVVLEKPQSRLEALAVRDILFELVQGEDTQEEGFTGVRPGVNLRDSLSRLCLEGASSRVEVVTPDLQGEVFLHQGFIVHAETEALTGEAALQKMLEMNQGRVILHSYEQPRRTSMAPGSWEYLLEEVRADPTSSREERPERPDAPKAEGVREPARGGAASSFTQPDEEPTPPVADPAEPAPVGEGGDTGWSVDEDPAAPTSSASPSRPGMATHARVDTFEADELVVCDRGGVLLKANGCEDPEARMDVIEYLESRAESLSRLLKLGRTRHIEITGSSGQHVAIRCDPELRGMAVLNHRPRVRTRNLTRALSDLMDNQSHH